MLASLQPCKKNHPNAVSYSRQYFNEIDIDASDFTNGFKCNDVHKVEKLSNLYINIFQSSFYPDHNRKRHNFLSMENRKNDSDGIVDLLIYKNHYVLNEKLHKFSGNPNFLFVRRRGSNCYPSQAVS